MNKHNTFVHNNKHYILSVPIKLKLNMFLPLII